jgi:hypothetical protein
MEVLITLFNEKIVEELMDHLLLMKGQILGQFNVSTVKRRQSRKCPDINTTEHFVRQTNDYDHMRNNCPFVLKGVHEVSFTPDNAPATPSSPKMARQISSGPWPLVGNITLWIRIKFISAFASLYLSLTLRMYVWRSQHSQDNVLFVT